MRSILVLIVLSAVFGGCNASDSQVLSQEETAPQPTPTNSITPESSTTLGPDWTPEWNQVAAYWSLNGTPGPIANGTVISSNVGTVGIASNRNASGMSYVALNNGSGIDFDGIDDSVYTDAAILPTGRSARTLCGWGMQNSTPGGFAWIASFGAPYQDQAMFIGGYATTLIGGGYEDDLEIPDFWAPNVWHHICLTYDGTNAALYADGAVVAGPSPKNWNLTSDVAYLGKQVNGSEYWNGEISEVAVWSTALTAQEVATIYTRQVTKF